MKEDNISQLGDYNVHSVNKNTRMGLVITLCSNSNHLTVNTPQTASHFRHLLSCGTIVRKILIVNHLYFIFHCLADLGSFTLARK